MTERTNHLPASGRTEVSPAVARVFAALCLLVLAAVPVGEHVLPVDGAGVLRAGPFAPFFADFAAVARPSADGAALFWRLNRRLQERMDELERALEDGSWLMERTLPAVQWLMAGWGGAGNEQTYVGRGGWLFYRSGLDYLIGPPFLEPKVLERRRRDAPSWREPPEPDPRPAILDFHRQLRARGIPLLVLPVPTKATVHPDGLAPSYAAREGGAPPLQNPSFFELRDALEADGVLLFDPTGTLERLRREHRAFLRTDSHWSPEGVDAVARELADRVRLLGLPFAAPEVEWRRLAQEHEGVGDLARMLRLPEWGKLFPPERVRLELVTDGRGRPWASDPRAEVLLLGDSFTNVYSDPGLGWGRAAGLAEQLAFHLRRAVDRIAINNDSATGVRRRLAEELRAGRPRLADKKLVIWQLAVRELVVGDWREVALP